MGLKLLDSRLLKTLNLAVLVDIFKDLRATLQNTDLSQSVLGCLRCFERVLRRVRVEKPKISILGANNFGEGCVSTIEILPSDKISVTGRGRFLGATQFKACN